MDYRHFAKPDPDFVRFNALKGAPTFHAERSRGVSMIALGVGVLLLLSSDILFVPYERAVGAFSALVMAFGAHHAFLVHHVARDKGIAVLATACVCLNAWLTTLAYGPSTGPAAMLPFAFMAITLLLSWLGAVLMRRQRSALEKAAKQSLEAFRRNDD